MFILFDTTGFRREASILNAEEGAADRAEMRAAQKKRKTRNVGMRVTCTAKASLSQELTIFKGVVRHTVNQDANSEDAAFSKTPTSKKSKG